MYFWTSNLFSSLFLSTLKQIDFLSEGVTPYPLSFQSWHLREEEDHWQKHQTFLTITAWSFVDEVKNMGKKKKSKCET